MRTSCHARAADDPRGRGRSLSSGRSGLPLTQRFSERDRTESVPKPGSKRHLGALGCRCRCPHASRARLRRVPRVRRRRVSSRVRGGSCRCSAAGFCRRGRASSDERLHPGSPGRPCERTQHAAGERDAHPVQRPHDVRGRERVRCGHVERALCAVFASRRSAAATSSAWTSRKRNPGPSGIGSARTPITLVGRKGGISHCANSPPALSCTIPHGRNQLIVRSDAGRRSGAVSTNAHLPRLYLLAAMPLQGQRSSTPVAQRGPVA